MTSPSIPAGTPALRLPWWAAIVVPLALFIAYAVLQENGVTFSGGFAQTVHEFFHDGRHALGVPCH